MEKNRCKHCNCNCHCNVKEHGDMYGLCTCIGCEHDTEECEACQQIQTNVVVCILKKKNNLENVVSWMNKKTQNKQHMKMRLTRRNMNKLFLILALLFALSACSVGKKCTYTQDGTKISSWVWFYKDKPIDLDKNNCSQYGSKR